MLLYHNADFTARKSCSHRHHCEKQTHANEYQLSNHKYGHLRFNGISIRSSARARANLHRLAKMVDRRNCWSHSMQTCLLLPRHFHRCFNPKYPITVDRYAGVVQQYRDPIITPRRRRVLIPLIWLISMGVHGTYFYTARLQKVNNMRYCIFSWEPAFDNLQAQRIYFVTISVILIAIPLVVIIVLYSLIFRSIIKQRSFWRTVSSFRMRRRKEDTKIIKKILAIIVLFVMCILPIDITGLLHFFAWQEKIPCGMDHLNFATKFIFYSNGSLNPCIYFLQNERYRQGLRNLLIRRNTLPETRVTLNEIAL